MRDREGHVDQSEEPEVFKGTGGTDLVQFLKGVRDQTARSMTTASTR